MESGADDKRRIRVWLKCDFDAQPIRGMIRHVAKVLSLLGGAGEGVAGGLEVKLVE